jgi:MFS family permease
MRTPGMHVGVAEALRTMHAAGIGRVFVAMLLFGAGVDVALFYVAPFTRTVGLERAAPFFGAYMGAAVATRLFGRRLLDELGPYRVAGPSLVLFGLGLAVLGFLPAPGVLPLAGLACGAGAGTIFPVLTALALSRSPAAHQGSATSLMTAALDLGGLAGIPVCGALAEAAGYPRAFAVVAVVEVAACVLLATDPRRRVAPPPAAG